VNHVERSTQTPPRRTGLFAALSALLRVPGSGAPSRGSTARRGQAAACVGLAFLCVGLAAPSAALAHFTRPFLCRISNSGGIAVDSEDHLWLSKPLREKLPNVGEPAAPAPSKLFEFDPAYSSCGGAVKSLEIEGFDNANRLAIERSTNDFYVTGQVWAGSGTEYVEVFNNTGGTSINSFGPFQNLEGLAVDNSSNVETKGDVYISGDGFIHKFDASGVEKSFSGSAPEYISGNEITGVPGEHGVFGTEASLTVDSHGDIYAAGGAGVAEFAPSGVFRRSFTGKGKASQSVAVDPTNGHVLVGIGEEAVDEFDEEGHFLSQIVEAAPGSPLHGVNRMAADSHGDVYVNDSVDKAVIVYGPGHFLPSFKLAEASQRKPTTATLSGEVDPEGFPLTQCAFEYVSEAAFQKTGFFDLSSGGSASCEPPAASIPVDKSFHPIEAALSGLTSGVTYRYRLTATSSGELGGAGESSILAFTAPHAPRVDSTAAGSLSSTFADLRARIDPFGAPTVYRFEYLTQAAFEANGGSFSGPDAATSVPVPDAGVGSGGETGGAEAAVVQPIGGLSPATLYRFRVVATNEIGVAAGEVNGGGEEVAHTFATLPRPVPGLPDGRAYELLTPVDKGTADDMFGLPKEENEFFNKDVGFASESGGGFLLETKAAFGSSPAGEFNAYVFSRAPAGWRTASLASPSLGVQNIPGTVFDPFDLSRVGVEDTSGSFASPAGSQRLSLLGAPGGPYATLHADAPLTGIGAHEERGEETKIVGGSRDLGHVVLESYGHALAAAPGAEQQDAGTHALYESSGGGECGPETANCTLVNVNGEGTLLNRCGAVLGLGGGIYPGATHNAVSADGSRVFFTAPDPTKANDGPGCWNGATVNTPQLYLRTGAQTVEVSEPAPEAPEATRHPAIYLGASEDGSRVFFLSEGELTKDDAGIHDPELYEYDLAKPVGERLTRVSHGESGSAAAGVWTVPAVAADGSAVYFTAEGVLASNQGADGTHASPGNCNGGNGSCNLYRYDTATAATTYIALVKRSDYRTTAASGWWKSSPALATEVGLDAAANWYTTPDGRFLLFASTRELTGYSTAEASRPEAEFCRFPGNSGGARDGHCDEVYRYDSATGGLTCVSCNPSGVPPVNNALFARSAIEQPSSGPVRAMSDDGSYVFFDTADALVPQDENHTLDVYEWHNGRVSLVSSGKDKAPSFFLGQSAAEIGGVHVEAANVFFGTHASLVPQDTGDSGDVYDARICAEADPCIKPPAGETAQCEGDACQNPPPAPIDATPGSLTFSGAGNLLLQALPSTKTVTPKKTIRCSKGRKLSHGKCVKTKTKKRKAKAKKAGNNRRVK
jgi:hypothetical protein